VDGAALCALRASPGLVCHVGAMADRLSARVRLMGGTGGCPVPARLWLLLRRLPRALHRRIVTTSGPVCPVKGRGIMLAELARVTRRHFEGAVRQPVGDAAVRLRYAAARRRS